MITTKKIDTVGADGLAKGPLCPLLGSCIGARCAWYNGDVSACVLAADSLQLIFRTAATDAAADIHKAYGDDLK